MNIEKESMSEEEIIRRLTSWNDDLLERTKEQYLKAAEAGDADAQLALAKGYKWSAPHISGIPDECFKWCEKAAEQGNAEAMCYLGILYLKDAHIPEEYARPVDLIRRSAEKGCLNGIAQMGCLYLCGRGVEQSFVKAHEYFVEAAEKGHRGAKDFITVHPHPGKGIDLSAEDAYKWGCSEGCPNSERICLYDEPSQDDDRHWYAKLFKAEGDRQEYVTKWYGYIDESEDAFDDPFDLLKENPDSPELHLQVGQMYHNGECVKQSDEKALEHFRFAAAKDSAIACQYLGIAYWNGEGVESSAEEANKWFAKGAELGDAGCQFFLSLSYYEGAGVEQSYQKAFELIKASAETMLEDDTACILGHMYERGQGTERSPEKAFETFSAGADQGCEQARYNLGRCYEFGIGTERSMDKAIECYTEASEFGAVSATIALIRIYDSAGNIDKRQECIESFEEDMTEWIEGAAEEGTFDDRYNVAYLYEHGLIVEKDEKKAKGLYDLIRSNIRE